jgi:hypothetical protein
MAGDFSIGIPCLTFFDPDTMSRIWYIVIVSKGGMYAFASTVRKLKISFFDLNLAAKA